MTLNVSCKELLLASLKGGFDVNGSWWCSFWKKHSSLIHFPFTSLPPLYPFHLFCRSLKQQNVTLWRKLVDYWVSLLDGETSGWQLDRLRMKLNIKQFFTWRIHCVALKSPWKFFCLSNVMIHELGWITIHCLLRWLLKDLCYREYGWSYSSLPQFKEKNLDYLSKSFLLITELHQDCTYKIPFECTAERMTGWFACFPSAGPFNPAWNCCDATAVLRW